MLNNNPLEKYKDVIALPPEEQIAYIHEHDAADLQTLAIHLMILISAIKQLIKNNKRSQN